MFYSRIFWKIYLKFILFIVLTGSIVGIFVTYQIQHDELRQTGRNLTAYADFFSDLTPEQLKEFSPSLQQRIGEYIARSACG